MQPVSLLPLREGTMDWRIEDHAWTGGGCTNKCLHLELAVPASGNLDTEIGCRAVLTLLVAHPRRMLQVFVKEGRQGVGRAESMEKKKLK